MARNAGPSLLVRMRQQLFSAVERRLHSYISFHLRPMAADAFGRSSFPTPTLPTYAVVLQGPLALKDEFTLQTLKIYGKLFPGAPLIVSTWKDAPEGALDAMRALPNVHVVESALPDYNGYGNTNYQIASTRAGIAKAEEFGAQYVLKTRTDQRLYANDLYPFLYSLTESFPLDAAGIPQKRIVALSYNTNKYRAYSLNDMFFFGTLADLKRYWDIPYDTRVLPKFKTVREWADARPCEAYFLTTYLGAIDHEGKDTLEDYWNALASYFILVDPSDLDWYWLKRARYQEYRERTYARFRLGEEVSFKEWLLLYKGLGALEPKPDVRFLDLPNEMGSTAISFE